MKKEDINSFTKYELWRKYDIIYENDSEYKKIQNM